MSILTALAVMSLFLTPNVMQEHDSAEMQQRLGFLAGSWTTLSTLPDTGEQLHGLLEYRWVLGGEWLRIEFRGNHPRREYWEAHGMMRWDAERSAYVAWVFFSADPPTLYLGTPLPDGGVSMSSVRDGVTYGIDYHPRGADQVYQENWTTDSDGSRRVTLKTTYERKH